MGAGAHGSQSSHLTWKVKGQPPLPGPRSTQSDRPKETERAPTHTHFPVCHSPLPFSFRAREHVLQQSLASMGELEWGLEHIMDLEEEFRDGEGRACLCTHVAARSRGDKGRHI